jgi:hypothetical protein
MLVIGDNTTVRSQLTNYTGGIFGSLPLIPLPRFPSYATCSSWSDACPYDALTAYVPAFGIPSVDASLGWLTNLEQDYMKLRALLGARIPDCNSRGQLNGIDNEPDYPLSDTIFASISTPFGSVVTLSTPAYNPPSVSTITMLLPSCQAFNSSAIVTSTPLMNADGSLRSDTSRSFCEGIVPEGTPIYVLPGGSLVMLNEAIRSSQWLFSLAPQANGCNHAFMQYVCWQV